MSSSKRANNRYSEAFKLQVVNDLESGKLGSVTEARRHYGITGSTTVNSWLAKYGRNHLIPKVIRVEKPDEQNQIKKLKDQIKHLKEALAETQCENLLNKAHFEVVCEDMGLDPEQVKKKLSIKRSTKRPRQPLKRRRKK